MKVHEIFSMTKYNENYHTKVQNKYIYNIQRNVDFGSKYPLTMYVLMMGKKHFRLSCTTL